MAHDRHDILLGLDWFIITGASINPSTNSLRFSSKTFYLNSATIIPDSVLNTVTDDSDGRLDSFMDEDDESDTDVADLLEEKTVEDVPDPKTEIKFSIFY